jgi:predicted PurR-regulated permease PerM
VIFYFKNFLPFIHKYFFGMLIDSAFILIFSLVLFAIFKVPYSLILAIIISITNLIPIIGPYIGGVPAVVVGFSNSFNLGIVAFVLVVVIQFIESNFIQPIIMKNKIKLHPVEGILGISLFGTLFGVSGMILSPILIVGFKTFFIPYK